MKALSNVDRTAYPVDLVVRLCDLYQFKGKDYYYAETLKNDMSIIVKTTVEKDTFYAGKLLGLDISDNRTKLVIKKGSTPKTKDEQVLANLKEVFALIQEKGDDIELTSNEFLKLGTRIFEGVKDVDFAFELVDFKENLFTSKKRVSRRSLLDEELKLYEKYLVEEVAEPTQLITNFYVDLLHLNVYQSDNEMMALLILYCLLFREGYKVFKYVSFFEKYYEQMEKFKTLTVSAGFNWEMGYSQTSPLNRLIIETMLDAYGVVESKTQIALFDKKIKKIDNVESTILKLAEIFTKDDIKQAHPNLSESTINRALKNLKLKGKIKSNGTGRSATWVRLVHDDIFSGKMTQMTLFDLTMEENEEEN